MKLLDVLTEEKITGEAKRVKDLFIKTFNAVIKSRSRDFKLNYIEDVIHSTLTKNDIKFLILHLQRANQKKKT